MARLKIISKGHGNNTELFIGDKPVGCEFAIQEIVVNMKTNEINSATITFLNIDLDMEIPENNITLKELKFKEYLKEEYKPEEN